MLVVVVVIVAPPFDLIEKEGAREVFPHFATSSLRRSAPYRASSVVRRPKSRSSQQGGGIIPSSNEDNTRK